MSSTNLSLNLWVKRSLKVSLLGLGLIFGLTRCHPADRHPLTVKQRLDAGDLVEFTEAGYRNESCPPDALDQESLEIEGEIERAAVVSGDLQSLIFRGYKNCARIGTTVGLTINRLEPEGGGRFVVTKLKLVRIDKLLRKHVSGKAFGSAETFSKMVEKLQSTMAPYHLGVVNIVDVEYIPGSAKDESQAVAKWRKVVDGDGFEQTEKDGDTLSSARDCNNKIWTDVSIPVEFQKPIFDRELNSWFNLGQRNCFRQGDTINVKLKFDDPAIQGRVRVKKIKRFKKDFLDVRFFDIGIFKFDTLKEYILAKDKPDNSWITVMDLEVAQ